MANTARIRFTLSRPASAQVYDFGAPFTLVSATATYADGTTSAVDLDAGDFEISPTTVRFWFDYAEQDIEKIECYADVEVVSTVDAINAAINAAVDTAIDSMPEPELYAAADVKLRAGPVEPGWIKGAATGVIVDAESKSRFSATWVSSENLFHYVTMCQAGEYDEYIVRVSGGSSTSPVSLALSLQTLYNHGGEVIEEFDIKEEFGVPIAGNKYGQTPPAVCPLPSGKVLLFGAGRNFQLNSMSKNAYIYEPGSGNRPVAVADAPLAHQRQSAILANGRAWFIGGEGHTGSTILKNASARYYDEAAGTWHLASRSSDVTYVDAGQDSVLEPMLAMLPSGRIGVFGGQAHKLYEAALRGSTIAYSIDPTSLTDDTQLAPIPGGRGGAWAVSSAEGVHLVGGYDAAGNELFDILAYNEADDEWTVLPATVPENWKALRASRCNMSRSGYTALLANLSGSEDAYNYSAAAVATTSNPVHYHYKQS